MLLERRPRPPLDRYVRALWALDQRAEGTRPARERMLPTGVAHVVFRLGAPVRIFEHPLDRGTAYWSVIGGPRAAPYVHDLGGSNQSVGVQLAAHAAPVLLGVPAADLAGRHTALDDVCGAWSARTREQLGEARSLAEKLDLLEGALLERLARSPELGNSTAGAVVEHALRRLGAGAEVGVVQRETGYSHRHFIDLFRARVGLPPKLYGRVVRFQSVIAETLAGPVRWAALAHAAGYCDQAHLSREFRALAGMSPREYAAAAPKSPNHVPLVGG